MLKDDIKAPFESDIYMYIDVYHIFIIYIYIYIRWKYM